MPVFIVGLESLHSGDVSRPAPLLREPREGNGRSLGRVALPHGTGSMSLGRPHFQAPGLFAGLRRRGDADFEDAIVEIGRGVHGIGSVRERDRSVETAVAALVVVVAVFLLLWFGLPFALDRERVGRD